MIKHTLIQHTVIKPRCTLQFGPAMIGCLLLLLFFNWTGAEPVSAASPSAVKPQLVEVRKIWDAAPHNAFTDLVRWRGKFYCAFREGLRHVDNTGKLRVLVSDDGTQWTSVTRLSMPNYDLRDASICVTPDDRLMVLGGAQQTRDGQRRTGTCVSFSNDGHQFSPPKLVLALGRWLWRVTWHGDQAYGISYGRVGDRQTSALHVTSDGLNYRTLVPRMEGVGEGPTEARLRFADDGTCYCLHRRDGETDNSALLGVAAPPYTDWKWHDLGIRLGGPNFLQLPDGRWIGAGRLYDQRQRTELVEIDVQRGVMKPLLLLPSGGDTSYPGMIWHQGQLWLTYYSSHEQRTSIYLAKIQFPGLEPDVVSVGDRLELFVDGHVIDSLDGVRQVLHHPRPAERVLYFDLPWEGPFSGYTTIFRDGDLLRAYYRGLPAAGKDGSAAETTCYAESRDGVQWTKPHLGIYELDGSRDNNVVLYGLHPASHNFSPFLDTNPQADPSARYKALGGTEKGLHAFSSSDGKRWQRIQETPVFTKGIFDSQNVSFWSAAEQQYVCYFRTWTQAGYRGFRTISRTSSKDFVNWDDPQPMSFGDTPTEHLYTNQTHPYPRAPHIYLGVAARFMPGRQVITPAEAEEIKVNPKYFGDCSDAVLLTSRGGYRYDRTFMESFVRPGLGLENWVSRTNYPALGVVQTSDLELSLYLQKNYGQPTAHLQRFTLRVDGFASIQAPYEGGTVLTKPLSIAKPSGQSSDERHLILNFATSAAGSISVELQNRQGTPLPGYTHDDCVPMIGDRIERVVRWNQGADVSPLVNQPIRVEFKLHDADLFSFRFP